MKQKSYSPPDPPHPTPSGSLTPGRCTATWCDRHAQAQTHDQTNIHTLLHDKHTHTITHRQHGLFPFPHPPHSPAVSLLYILAIRWHPCSLSPAGGKRWMHYDSNVLEDSNWLQSMVQNSCLLPRRRLHVKFSVPFLCTGLCSLPNLVCPCFRMCVRVCASVCVPGIYVPLHVKCRERESVWKGPENEAGEERDRASYTNTHTHTHTHTHRVYVCMKRPVFIHMFFI